MIATAVPRPRGVKIGTGSMLWFALALATAAANALNRASIDFSLLSGLFVILTYLTVVAAGGLKTLIGAVVMYAALQHVIIACFAKLISGQPIEDRLDIPVTTMEIYCVGMFSMLVGVYLGSKVLSNRKKVLFEPVLDAGTLTRLAWAAFILECVQVPLVGLRGSQLAGGDQSNGGLLAAFLGMQWMGPFAIACATGACILRTDKKRSIDYRVILTVMPAIALGLYGANRTVAVNAVGTYFLASLLFGFRFRLQHIITLSALGWFAIVILFPYAHYARNEVRGSDISRNISRAVALFEDVVMNPSKYQSQTYPDQLSFREAQANTPATWHTYFYLPRSDTLERFATLKFTDEIVNYASKTEPWGLRTVIDGIQLATPSILESDKPLLADNNVIGHLVPGLLAPKDGVTQPNTGLFADGFVSFRWAGVAIYPGIALFIYMVVYGFITRQDMTSNPYAIALVLLIAHTYAETSIGQQITLMTFAAIYTIIGFVMVRSIANVMQGRRFKRPASRALKGAQSA